MPADLIKNIDKTCAFTGHRNLGGDLDTDYLVKVLKEFIDGGYDTFLCGMAAGFDLLAAQTVAGLKENYPHLKLIACIPCEGQSRYFSAEEKKKYDEILKNCNQVKVLNGRYYKGCMQMRDRFMVDNSSLLIAYRRTNTGGTHYTVKYALSQNKKICLL